MENNESFGNKKAKGFSDYLNYLGFEYQIKKEKPVNTNYQNVAKFWNIQTNPKVENEEENLNKSKSIKGVKEKERI